jgi:soluble lytic murein transglycosylase
MTPWILTLLLAAPTPAPAATVDPRIDLVALQLRRDFSQALELTRAEIQSDPDESARLGLHYLEGHLLDLLDRPKEASSAFARALRGPEALRPHARMRLASIHGRLRHPEVAAGLIASVLSARDTPRELLAPAARELRRFIEAGGDCGLLVDLGRRPLPKSAIREIILSRARCASNAGRVEEAKSLLLSILSSDRSDDVALRAAELLTDPDFFPAEMSGLSRLIGLTFHAHREFELAELHLTKAIQQGSQLKSDSLFESRYSLARSQFWLAKYDLAARLFHDLAATARKPVQRAQSRFQEARCYELSGIWAKAASAYLESRDEDPHGAWSGAAQMAALRIYRLEGDLDRADEILELLGQRQSWGKHRARAALFLAISAIAEEDTDGVERWLDLASRGRQIPEVELAYWRGRHAILTGDTDRAIHELTLSLTDAPYHPIARAARRALLTDPLASATVRAGEKLSWSDDPADLERAWMILGDSHRRGQIAFEELLGAWKKNPQAAELLAFQPIPPADWPLWTRSMTSGDEALLALGIFHEGARAIPQAFPVSEPTLALTGSHLLVQSGQIRRSLYQAEIVHKRHPKGLPEAILPHSIQRLEYPLGYAYIVLSEARKHKVSPHLLAAIVREESRFDPAAVSAAAARGLAQFVLPTAREVSADIGIARLSSEDLHRPEISVALGAAYLARLGEQFDGRQEMVVAAYNAGEPQAELWRQYCLSEDPAEYFSKVGFNETRGYLAKVLSSQTRYDELYPNAATAAAPPRD